MTDRVLIFGNSGAGKSTLARKLASERGSKHIDLDTVAWLPTDPPQRLPLPEAQRQLQSLIGDADAWVAEGCYADLIELLLPNATEMIFLDLPVSQCQAHARDRPWEPHKYPSKEAQDANLEMLLDWIATYPNRDGELGRNAHVALFDAFGGKKRRLGEPW